MGRRVGFTLFEMVIVVMLMLIFMGLASPWMFQALYSDTKVKAGADMVRARWADCRAQAVEESRPYRFAVVPNSRKFKIEPFQGNLENADTAFLGTDQSTIAANPGLVLEDMLPDGVRFGTKDEPANPEAGEATGSDYKTVAIFLPDGTAQDDVEITFGGKGSATITLKLRAFTGSATTIRKKGDGSEMPTQK